MWDGLLYFRSISVPAYKNTTKHLYVMILAGCSPKIELQQDDRNLPAATWFVCSLSIHSCTCWEPNKNYRCFRWADLTETLPSCFTNCTHVVYFPRTGWQKSYYFVFLQNDLLIASKIHCHYWYCEILCMLVIHTT